MNAHVRPPAAFLRCSVPEIEYGSSGNNRGTIQNPPVNLANVSHITKGTHAWYPDNVGMCTIEFHMLGENTPMVRWCFPQRVIQWALKPSSYELSQAKDHWERRRLQVKDIPDPKERDAEFDSIMARFEALS